METSNNQPNAGRRLNQEEQINKFIQAVEPFFDALFPLLNTVTILAKKIELKAYKYKAVLQQQRKRDLSTIESTAIGLRRQCDKYGEDWLLYKADEDTRNDADMIMLRNSNLAIYFQLRLQNAIVGGMTDEDLLRIDTALKLAVHNTTSRYHIDEEVIQEFNIR